MNIKYVLGAIVSIPLLPLLYFQGKKIKKTIPKLPEATGNEGFVASANHSTFQLITIGESTIAGVGVKTHADGFTGTLANSLSLQLGNSISWKVYAKSGYTAKRVTNKIIPKITEKPVDLIVIGLGGNDSFELNSPKKWRKDIRDLITRIRTSYAETPIVFINMPPIKEFPAFTGPIKFIIGNLVLLLGKELEKVVRDYENVFYYSSVVTYDDFINRMNLDATPADFFSDGVHPSELAYQVWAKDVADFIKKQSIFRTN